jgi:hypothetical protein
MKKIFLIVLFSGIVFFVFSEKPEFKPYGFIKGDMYYAIGGVSSWGKPSLTCASMATGLDTNAISFTAQHTRIGLTGKSNAGDVSFGGLAEVDFFSVAANANAKPRMRLAYAWCRPIKWLEIRAGQQWDIFSPLNPTTNNTNANLWYNGNYGFRRPQMTLISNFSYIIDHIIQFSAGEATREDELSVSQDSLGKVSVGSWLGQDNLSRIPLIQARYSANYNKNFEVGVSFAYATYGKDRGYNTMGIGIDANLMFNKLFALKAEYAYGKNLNNANLFTTGGNGNNSKDVLTNGFWIEATSKPATFLNLVLGTGIENVVSAVSNGNPTNNRTLYADLIFPVGEYFSLSFEYQLLNTKIMGQSKENIAHLFDVAGKITF